MSAKFALQLGLAIVYIIFGFYKIIDVSPAYELVSKTVFWWDPEWFVPVLGIGEMLIGLLFLFKKTIKPALVLFTLHMIATFSPFLIVPEEAWQSAFILSLEGQYIVKNVVLIAAGWALYKLKAWR